MVKFKNIVRKIATLFFLTFIFLAVPSKIVANDGALVETPQYQIEKLNEKIDALILDRNEESKNNSEMVIGLANLQMQLITVILAVVGVIAGIGVPVAAIFLRKEIKMIEDKAMLSVVNMNAEVNKIKLSEKTIIERKKKFDKLYADIEMKEKEIDERIKKLKSVEGTPEERDRLAEIEQEVLALKRKVSQGIQPYTWSVSTSPSGASGYPGTFEPVLTTTPTSTSSFGAVSPSSATTTTTTVEPFYPSPSPSPSPAPPETEDDESDK